MYCFLFDSFSESDWNTLSKIYNQLPNFQPISYKTVPYWFGTEEKGNYLWASVELSGLQVAGKLRAVDWLAWETAFNELIQNSSLPRYKIEL
ncbi:MAG: hypothetical protein EOO37_05240 [Cytophagaceae bacterium]|nr:MAG: hypothetical protein EOO37_05240 [Cytophagaceae bacterium]